MTNKWNLTERESQVLCMLASAADGNSKRAARTLDLSPKTVDEYVLRARKKMGAPSRMAAIIAWDREHRACSLCLLHRLEAA